MASFEAYRAGYERNWLTLQIRPGRKAEADKHAARLIAGKPRYLEVERRTGVPWWFVGLCHYRESTFNWNTYLGNGQALGRKTTIVPIGRGPFATFEDGACDALKLQGFAGEKDWTIGRVAFRLEGFNGYGYHDPYVRGTRQKLGHPVPSAYLYGGSTVYEKGKYTEDHYFDPDFVDPQLGTLVVLKALLALDGSVRIGNPVATLPVPKPLEKRAEAPPVLPPPDIEPVPPKPASGGLFAAAVSLLSSLFKKG